VDDILCSGAGFPGISGAGRDHKIGTKVAF